MTPEVSRVVGAVIQSLGLSSGLVTDELRSEAERATMVDELPQWVRNVWEVIRGEGR